MSIAFNAFGIILLVSRSYAVLLSVCIGVGGWVAKFFKRVAHGEGGFCIDKEGAKFCLRGG